MSGLKVSEGEQLRIKFALSGVVLAEAALAAAVRYRGDAETKQVEIDRTLKEREELTDPRNETAVLELIILREKRDLYPLHIVAAQKQIDDGEVIVKATKGALREAVEAVVVGEIERRKKAVRESMAAVTSNPALLEQLCSQSDSVLEVAKLREALKTDNAIAQFAQSLIKPETQP